ncbi:MAG: hypothetical protein AAF900_01705 [Bacteroidota bacterium]
MKRKNIFLIAFVSIVCIIAGYLLWRYYEDTQKSAAKLAQKHVVLIGEKATHITRENRMLGFLANNSKYCVWYVLSDKAVGASNKQAVVVDDIMDKEKVINGIKTLAKQGLVLNKIGYMLILPNTKEAFALQKDLHKEFSVKAGCTQNTMEGILAQYQAQGTHGQNEVHLVLKNGEELVAKAMIYAISRRQELGSSYESYIELNDNDKVTSLIDSAMKFAKEKQYANGGLTVYFDAQDNIKGIQPFSRLFPKLSYRNIFERYKPSQQEAYQARVYCTIKPANDFDEQDTLQLLIKYIKEQCGPSLKSIRIPKENEAQIGRNIALDRDSTVPVGAQVGLYLQNKSRDTLVENIERITDHPLISPFSFEEGV